MSLKSESSGGPGGGKRDHVDLSVEEKKQLLMEWFQDDELRNVGTFCVDVKGVPRARPFLRRAAKELDLVSLRKIRRERADADQVALSRIENFCPNAGRGVNKKADGKGGAKLDMEQKKKLLLEWFVDDERRNIGKFCADVKGVPRARPFLKKAAEDLDLVSLRKVRKERADADEVAKARISEYRPNANRRETRAKDKDGNGGEELSLEQKRQLLLEWFTDDEQRNIGKFCVDKGAPQARPFLRRAAKQLDLVPLREAAKEEGDSDEEAEAMILEYVPKADRRESKAKDEHGNGGKDLSLEEKRQLLLEWFIDGKQRNVAKFCADKGAPQARPFLRRAAKQLDLVSLREASKEEGYSNEEAKAMILEYVPKANRRESKAKDEDGNRGKDLSLEEKRQLLLEWFTDDKQRNIGKFCADKGSPQARPFLRRAAKQLDLASLREASKEEGDSDEAAEAMILEYVPKASRRETKSKDKVETERSKPTMEQKKQFCLEWFCDDEERNIGAFCADVERAPRHFLRRAAEDLDLVPLRKARKQQADADDVAEARILEYQPSAHDGGKHGRVKGAGGGRRDQLSVEEKKQLLLEWFRDDEERNIGKFCVDAKGLPRARPFLKRAAEELDLVSLRKVRKDQDDADDIAESRILEYHPDAKRSRMADGSKRGNGRQNIDVEQKKQLLMEWFVDSEERNIRKFCVEEKGAPQACAFLKRAAEKLDLFSLRKVRKEQSNADEVAASRIASFSPGAKRHETPKNEGFQAELKAALKGWFDDENNTPMRKFLEERGENGLRPCAAKLVKENGLRKLRRQRDNPNVRQLALKKIDDIFSIGPAEEEPAKPQVVEAAQDDANEAADPEQRTSNEEMKAFLEEWFKDENMRPVRRFLKQRNASEAEAPMMHFIKENGLHKLRKRRDEDEVQQAAMDIIDTLSVGDSADTGTVQKKGPSGKNRVHGKRNKVVAECVEAVGEGSAVCQLAAEDSDVSPDMKRDTDSTSAAASWLFVKK